MPRPASYIPHYRLHKPTGKAVVTIDGKDRYLGRFNSAESRQAYDRLITEWIAAGRGHLDRSPSEITVNEVMLAYLKYADQRYSSPLNLLVVRAAPHLVRRWIPIQSGWNRSRIALQEDRRRGPPSCQGRPLLAAVSCPFYRLLKRPSLFASRRAAFTNRDSTSSNRCRREEKQIEKHCFSCDGATSDVRQPRNAYK